MSTHGWHRETTDSLYRAQAQLHHPCPQLHLRTLLRLHAAGAATVWEVCGPHASSLAPSKSQQPPAGAFWCTD